MLTKGVLDTITQHLANGVRERRYPRERRCAGRRLHAASPGDAAGRHGEPVADGRPSTVKDIADAVLYLTDAATVTGHILYVDGGAHVGRW